MKLNRSKEWWMNKIKDEPEVPIGAGGTFYARQPLGDRIMRFLGFGRCAPDLFDDIADDSPDWAPGRIHTDVLVYVSFMDRLRLLLSGKMLVVVSQKTSVNVPKVMSRSTVAILSPFDKE